MSRHKIVPEIVFGGAYVVDVDMSCWCKRMSIYCIADHMSELTSYELGPLFRVDFIQPVSVSIDFADSKQLQSEYDSHPFWYVGGSSVKKTAKVMEVSLHGHDSYPRMVVVCKDIWAIDCDTKLFEQVDPDAGSTQRAFGLHRPSIEKINEIIRNGRKSKHK
jgi:hypothetical protein